MKLMFTFIFFTGILSSCNHMETAQPSNSIVGTWKLVAATMTLKDTTTSTFNPKNKMIKIITPTHFAFFNHDLKQGKDSSAAFTSGGGRYTLSDSTYTEHLEYCNYREWENKQFTFTIKISNDTLTQQGVEKIDRLGINRIIHEKYVRVK